MTPPPLDPGTVHARLASVEELVAALRLVRGVDGDRLRADVLTRLAVERALTQAVDQLVAVCSHVVVAEGGRAPSTYREAVLSAADTGVLDAELARSLAAAVGLRNLLVHEYARADLDLVAAAVPAAERDLDGFVRQVAGWLRRRG